MKCIRCDVTMVLGIAIKYDDRPFGIFTPRLNKDTLEIIDVLKCPKCGHSKEIKKNLFDGDDQDRQAD